MHGRLKVKSTERQEAERRAEKAAKVEKYRQLIGDVLEKRGKAEFEMDVLRNSGFLLMSNPDISVLWNIRKEILVKNEETSSKGNSFGFLTF